MKWSAIFSRVFFFACLTCLLLAARPLLAWIGG